MSDFFDTLARDRVLPLFTPRMEGDSAGALERAVAAGVGADTAPEGDDGFERATEEVR